jgi:hypothetical protein
MTCFLKEMSYIIDKDAMKGPINLALKGDYYE